MDFLAPTRLRGLSFCYIVFFIQYFMSLFKYYFNIIIIQTLCKVNNW